MAMPEDHDSVQLRRDAMRVFDILAAQAALHGITVEKLDGPIAGLSKKRGGYYSHRRRHIAVRTDAPDPLFAFYALAHELGHAFRDRHFFGAEQPPSEYYSDPSCRDGAERQAERFVGLLFAVMAARIARKKSSANKGLRAPVPAWTET